MSKNPLEMDKIRHVLEMHEKNIPIKEITRILALSRNTVRKYIRKYYHKDSGADSVITASNEEIASVVFTEEKAPFNSQRHITLIEHFQTEREHLLKRRGNKQVIWEEYRQANPEGYSYSQYCLLLRQYVKKLDLSMVMEYNPAEVMEIDFAGKGLSYVEEETGEVINCQIFVAVLPFSGMVFCRAVHSQQTADVVLCINAMLKYFGGLPTGYILCDNMKTLVSRASKKEPVFSEACNQLSAHYQVIFSAARPYSPRDKAHVERHVEISYNRIYTPLRHHQFRSLEDLNAGIAIELDKLNRRGFRESEFSRLQLFNNYEKPLLQPLSPSPFILKEVREATVARNYHVELRTDGKRQYYSVPWQHVGKRVKICYDQQTVEVYLLDYTAERIAVHQRHWHKKYITADSHMTREHLAVKKTRGWSNEYFYSLADHIGPATRRVIEKLIARQPNRTQAYRTCMALLSLNIKDGTAGRLEAACNRVSEVPRPSFAMVQNILMKGLDKAPFDENQPDLFSPVQHENIRGKQNYR